MSLWSRLANVFRSDGLRREIDEELASHIEEAVGQGRDPVEVRRAFGSPLRLREASMDIRHFGWLDSLRADAVFGWRQIRKTKVMSATAILSLALALGACTAAFRLIDGLFLRPLPVAHPEQLYALSREGYIQDGKPSVSEWWGNADFRRMRAAVKGTAELIGISGAERMDLTYRSDREMERAELQYVSGWMFQSFALRPALGRLLTEDDDLKPLAHPYVVLSYEYWTRRFGRDPKVIGRTLTIGRKYGIGSDLFQIIGVVADGFTGTEPGKTPDMFIPTMMSALLTRPEAGWLRTFVRMEPGVAQEPVRDRMTAVFRASKEGVIDTNDRLRQTLLMASAAAGVSGMQKDFGLPLTALGLLVTLVLLVACANVANLMLAQAAARAREMALRVSIGAGRGRLVQLVLVESAMLALLAAAGAALFAAWAARFVVGRIHPADNPARLPLPGDWRVFGFGLALTLGVTVLFGLAPALRASAVRPSSALKGGDDPQSRHRLMHLLIAVQAAFCFVALFGAGLFVTTFDRLSHRSTGFSSERLVHLDALAEHAEPEAFWDRVTARLRRVPGVEAAALADWPLLGGGWGYHNISVNGSHPTDEQIAWFLNVSPGWVDTMNIPLLDGRDFRAKDISPVAGVGTGAAIVNIAFARKYLSGANPIGRWFEARSTGYWPDMRFQVVGLVRDATYRFLREPVLPVVYIPFHRTNDDGTLQARVEGTFVVRTTDPDPLALAPILSQEITRVLPGSRIRGIRTQNEIIESQTVRERLLAMLALFFAVVVLALAGIGLYGVLDYSVFQRQREIGIRMALGAQAGDLVRRVTQDVFSMVLLGATAGVGFSMASVRYIETLLYGVKPADAAVLGLPLIAIPVAAVIAALPALTRAVRTDPIHVLRAE
jgi:predicted permease